MNTKNKNGPTKLGQPQSYLDMLFANRNKLYGAYDLRVNYPKLLKRSIVLCFGIAAISYCVVEFYEKPRVITTYGPRNYDTLLRVTEVNLGKQLEEIKPAKSSEQDLPILEVVPDDRVPPAKPTDPSTPDATAGEPSSGGGGNGIDPGTPGGTGTGTGSTLVTPPEPPIVLPTPVPTPTIVPVVEDTDPSFPGGFAKLTAYLQEKIAYPEDADGVAGRVVVEFTIDENGNLSDIELLNALHPALEAEARRVIKLMPRWKPGTHLGKPIESKWQIPISFTVPEEQP
jgi:periplasmic protein TonB